MNDYIIFMFDDAPDRAAAQDGGAWGEYLTALRRSGQFDGGSSIGSGERLRKGAPDQPSAPRITGFIRVRADDIEQAKRLLRGNPNYEAGGSVEIRPLIRD